MKTGIKIMTVFFVGLILCQAVQADELLVPSQYPTIQAAIDDCNNGDTVIVAPAVYAGIGNRDIDFKGKAIAVRSVDPNDPNIVAATIVDCDGSEAYPHRGFYFHSGEDANSVVEGLTIINGYGFKDPNYHDWSLGGGIYCEGSGPTITNCVIRNNKATQGGGIFAWKNSSPIIINCTISENGGGIYLWRNTPATITNCLICDNGGRGIYFWDNPYAEVSNCRITGNAMFGINFSGNGAITINNCIVSDNYMSGIACSIGTATISNCVISGNTNGGIKTFGITTIKNSTITGNSAYEGGGIRCGKGETTIINSIVRNNTNEDIYIWNDIPPNGGPYDPTELTVSYSCPGVIVNNGAILILGSGNIDGDPFFADPYNGDYHLKSAGWRWDNQRKMWTWDDITSPCIDKGNPGSSLGEELLSVPDDPHNEWSENLRINMGAYGGTAEASMAPPGWPLLADLSNNEIVNFLDFAGQVQDWLMAEEEQPGDLNRNGVIDGRDLAILAESWLRYKPFVVSITKPEDGDFFDLWETIEIEVYAGWAEDSAIKVEFFANGIKIGEDNDGGDGWKINWENQPHGIYDLTAKATNYNGITKSSALVRIIIGGPPPS